jgi:hypothetical protein
MKHLKTPQELNESSENLNISDVSDSKNQYTVVSQDSHNYKWGIEGDFEAYDEDDAMSQAIKQAKKYGAKRQMFNVFLANSDELKDFMNTHDFID